MYSDSLKADTDGDGLTDYEEMGRPVFSSLKNEKVINNKQKNAELIGETTKSSVRTFMASRKYKSNPQKKDTDKDGIPDKYDPDRKVHFGIVEMNKKRKRRFKLAVNINAIPKNKGVYDALKVSPSNEWEVYKNRFSKKYKADWHQAIKVLSIKTNARTTASFGIVASSVGVLKRASKLLRHYNKASGKLYFYDAKKFLKKSKDVGGYYNKNINAMRQACEQATSKGVKVTIASRTNAGFTGAMGIDGKGFQDYDSWLSLGKAEAAMAGQCTYDGKTYKLELNYFIEDCYDFFEPNEADGRTNRIGGCTNDELVILSYYDEAEPFISIGHYYVEEMTWEKGERLEE